MIAGMEILQKMNLFSGIHPEEILSILNSARYQRYLKGECIALEGEDCSAFGIVESGSIVILKENSSGESQILAKMDAGKIFGEILVYSSKKKWPASIWATDNCGIYFLDLTKISLSQTEFPHLHSRLMQNFMRELSDKALGLNKKLEYLTLKKIRGKISKYLLEQSYGKENQYFTIPFNRKEMADYLSISRPTMSREMAKMKEEGLLDYYKNSFKILNKIALEKSIH
ncbi:MAG: Crp/Fnr family transcriptional regulator [Eubacteriales bacterium]|nr:Crp/Fnr family transcriptional regulator [Eubacteriales bacterium]